MFCRRLVKLLELYSLQQLFLVRRDFPQREGSGKKTWA
jgi:hypothetical protein